jgi:Bacteriocin class II with double-glycine leader peptide
MNISDKCEMRELTDSELMMIGGGGLWSNIKAAATEVGAVYGLAGSLVPGGSAVGWAIGGFMGGVGGFFR